MTEFRLLIFASNEVKFM